MFLLNKLKAFRIATTFITIAFEAYQLSSKTITEHLKKSWKDGTWAETIDSFS